jgi:hypothetical protein
METNEKTGFSRFVDCHINHINDNRERILIFFTIFILILFLAGTLGSCLSFLAQPGGITKINAFIAPFLGPWSQILPPNSHEMRFWSERYKIFAISLTAVLVLFLAGSILFINFWLSYMSTVITFFAIVIWVLCGLGKVVTQLS